LDDCASTVPCDPFCNNKIGDLHCDPYCNREACAYDGGDCWCSKDCPHGLLTNNVCDPTCRNPECYYDFGKCDCAAGCPFSSLGDGNCTAACDNVACGFDNGDCPNYNQTAKEPYPIDHSTYRVVLYNISSTSNCPDLKALPNNVIPNDQLYYTVQVTTPLSQQNPDYIEATSSKGQELYFGVCYPSYNFGFFVATRNPPEDRSDSQAIFNYNCATLIDGHCNLASCMTATLNQGECTKSPQNDYFFKMNWVNSSVLLCVPWALTLFCLVAGLLSNF